MSSRDQSGKEQSGKGRWGERTCLPGFEPLSLDELLASRRRAPERYAPERQAEERRTIEHGDPAEQRAGTPGPEPDARRRRAEYVFAPALLEAYGLAGEAPLALKLRARLMERLRAWVEAECRTQAYAAEVLGISQPRVSDLVNRKAGRFSLEALLGMCERAGITVVFYVSPA